MKNGAFLLLLAALFLLPGCIFAKFDMNLFKDYGRPLQEFTLSGDGDDKVVLIPVMGTIDSESAVSLVTTEPSVIQETVAHLQMAAQDERVKAVVLQIDSPGGTVTASDILYREIKRFKQQRPQVRVVAAMMDTAASGGYYIAAAGDRIVAHPTTVTGSIGVILVRPDISGLMDKIGAKMVVTQSGGLKDMGNPFRQATEKENQVFQDMIDEYYDRFVDVVAKGRGMSVDQVRKIADGRIYTGSQAKELGLVDKVGYLEDAVAEARNAADLPRNAQLVVYRRSRTANDNIYNTATLGSGAGKGLIDLGIDRYLPEYRTGFYYLWLPEG